MRRLPRGRNALPPEEVARLQRARLCQAMAEVMAEKGYAGTAVEDVLKRAGVSRLSFYRLFDSKIDCFMAALDGSAGRLLERVAEALGSSGAVADPLERYERGVAAYLDALEAEWPSTRLCLVETYAAGPRAVAHRNDFHQAMAEVHADILGVTDEVGLLACRMVTAAIIALITAPVAENDREGLRAVGPKVIDHVRLLWNRGAFGPGTGPG
ncbi:TetR family transcriptional regulator [Thermomonospora umbrina]|uniref:TetR family transcriptional regulator n=2 Tax=Thermomonospora umbrina TaxID=111806 RepID=A0A3D9SW98_9ACTN|nr:TetR family transcriptional regulator [Thermomonospora umbrina]